jgi:hypothetical protein
MKKLKCDLCGTPVKIVGHTTKHYEPIVPILKIFSGMDKEEIACKLFEIYDGDMKTTQIYEKAEAISKLIRGEK